MAALKSLVETRIKDAENILSTQMPQDQSQRPSPRVLKRLEDAKDALKAQHKRKGHLTKYWLSKDQDVKASKVRVRTVRCRRLMVNKDEALKAVADEVDGDIDPIPKDKPKSKKRPYGLYAKVLIQSPKTKH